MDHDAAERDDVMGRFHLKVKLLVEELRKVDGVTVLMPPGTFYVFPNVAPICRRLGITSHGLALYLLEAADDQRGVACLGGECFGEAGQGFLRFSCGGAGRSAARGGGIFRGGDHAHGARCEVSAGAATVSLRAATVRERHRGLVVNSPSTARLSPINWLRGRFGQLRRPMPTKVPRHLLHLRYFEAEQEYLKSLPPEHFMEVTPQATQRKITLESFDLITAVRPEVQVFNELLVQYERKQKGEDKDKKRLGQVVPDNMVVLHDERIKAEGSFNLPLQPVRPFLVLEYVSKSNKRKDYDDNMLKYEHEIKVQYYLSSSSPTWRSWTIYRHKRPQVHQRQAETRMVAVRDSGAWSWRLACATAGCATGSAASSRAAQPGGPGALNVMKSRQPCRHPGASR